jgi:hypothetical protein
MSFIFYFFFVVVVLFIFNFQKKKKMFTSFKEREEWKDVEPVPQNEGENPVVPINYSHECRNLKVLI